MGLEGGQALALLLVGFVIGVLVMVPLVFSNQEAIYTEAIVAGAATRVVDQQTGEVSIEWRTCE